MVINPTKKNLNKSNIETGVNGHWFEFDKSEEAVNSYNKIDFQNIKHGNSYKKICYLL